MTKKDALRTVKQVKEFYKSKKKYIPSFEKFASECIMTDLCDRGTIESIFSEIKSDDPACFKDIKKTWEHIIRECFDYFTANEIHGLVHGDDQEDLIK